MAGDDDGMSESGWIARDDLDSGLVSQTRFHYQRDSRLVQHQADSGAAGRGDPKPGGKRLAARGYLPGECCGLECGQVENFQFAAPQLQPAGLLQLLQYLVGGLA